MTEHLKSLKLGTPEAEPQLRQLFMAATTTLTCLEEFGKLLGDAIAAHVLFTGKTIDLGTHTCSPDSKDRIEKPKGKG